MELPCGGLVVKDPSLPMQKTRFQSLVGELRAHMLHCMAKKKNQILAHVLDYFFFLTLPGAFLLNGIEHRGIDIA